MPTCKICHKEIEESSLFHQLFAAKTICLRCFQSLKPIYHRWSEDGVSCLAIYPYSQAFQSLIFLYKKCGDIELAPVFLERCLPFLRLFYPGYVVVAAPSHQNKIEERGFDHLPTLLETFGHPVIRAFVKTEDVKQSDLGRAQRKAIGKAIRFLNPPELTGRKILFVDDVCTTGSTLRACLSELKKAKPKKLKALLLAKVPKGWKDSSG